MANIEKRIEKLEQDNGKKGRKFYWWDLDESEQEFLNRSSLTKADLHRDDVSIFSWQR